MGTLKKLIVFLGWAFAGLMGLFFVLVLVLIFAISRAGVGDGADLASLTSKSEHAVGVVELSGEIISSKGFKESLGKAVKNENLKALVVRIDSPGGSVGASEEIYRAIKLASEKKPIVCSLANVAASGGLYAAVGCQKIVANRGTLTGSIGVIMMMPNFTNLIGDTGFAMNVVKSGKFKDTGSPFRTFGEEDRGLIQSIVDRTYEQFVAVIAESRELEIDAVKAFADGRIILGDQALEYGLIDEIGGLNKAAKIALELTGDTAEPEIVMPKKPSGLLSVLDDLREAKLWQWIRTRGQTRLLYQAYL